MRDEREIEIDYTNFRGERRWRRVIPEERGIYFGTSPDHKTPQWLLSAHDVEKNARRTFSLNTIHGIRRGE